MRLSLTTFLLSSLSASSVLGAPQSNSVTSRATVCNGHAELCDRSFGSVSFVGSHDSYAIGVNNLAANQDQNITTQLNDGIRMLQVQAHSEAGDIKLCHTTCGLYDGGTLADYLREVRSWLDTNRNEVLSLLIVNIDNLPATQYGEIFTTVGLDAVSFIPESTPLPAASWPTLGSMIDSGRRLVTFIDNGAGASVPFIIDEFTNIWETEFNVLDPAFNCNINRTNANIDSAGQMYLINHFLDRLLPVINQPVPFIDQLNVTNAATGPGSLGAQVDTCVAQHTRPPNFMLVDYYEFGGGSVFDVAARINGVEYNPTRPIASPVTTETGSTSSLPSSPSGGSTSSRPLNGGISTLGSSSQGFTFAAFSLLTAALVGPCLLSF